MQDEWLLPIGSPKSSTYVGRFGDILYTTSTGYIVVYEIWNLYQEHVMVLYAVAYSPHKHDVVQHTTHIICSSRQNDERPCDISRHKCVIRNRAYYNISAPRQPRLSPHYTVCSGRLRWGRPRRSHPGGRRPLIATHCWD